MKPLEVHVECYSGSRADERPLRYSLGDRTVEIVEIVREWREPGGEIFEVRDADGHSLRLQRGQASDRWTLDWI